MLRSSSQIAVTSRPRVAVQSAGVRQRKPVSLTTDGTANIAASSHLISLLQSAIGEGLRTAISMSTWLSTAQ